MKRTTQQCCAVLIIRNSWKYNYGDLTVMHCLLVYVSLQLGEVTIYRTHSLEPSTWFECLRKSFAFFAGLFPLAIAFELSLLCTSILHGFSFSLTDERKRDKLLKGVNEL